MTNLLADLSVRFNVSSKRNVEHFFIPYSNLNISVVALLLKYNCISSFNVDLSPLTRKLRIKVKPLYLLSEPLIRKISLVSKPGRRVYWTSTELALNYSKNNFQGFFILSTPRGICSSNELIAGQILSNPVSGEILLKVDL